MSSNAKHPVIGIIMGSKSDFPVMEEAVKIVKDFGISHEVKIISAHRTPDRMVEYAKNSKERGLKIIIAGAGGAAHLPGMVASMTTIPVLGVPIESKSLKGMDSLLSIVQMPGGIPVGTFAIGTAGAKNAALLAVAMLAAFDDDLAVQLDNWRLELTNNVALEP